MVSVALSARFRAITSSWQLQGCLSGRSYPSKEDRSFSLPTKDIGTVSVCDASGYLPREQGSICQIWRSKAVIVMRAGSATVMTLPTHSFLIAGPPAISADGERLQADTTNHGRDRRRKCDDFLPALTHASLWDSGNALPPYFDRLSTCIIVPDPRSVLKEVGRPPPLFVKR